MTFLMPKGIKLDGTNPSLITGYGGYEISITPRFRGDRLWFEIEPVPNGSPIESLHEAPGAWRR